MLFVTNSSGFSMHYAIFNKEEPLISTNTNQGFEYYG